MVSSCSSPSSALPSTSSFAACVGWLDEVKLKYNYEKNPDKAYDQVCRYMDHLGVSEGWLVVFDPDMSVSWDAKLGHADLDYAGKRIHLFRC